MRFTTSTPDDREPVRGDQPVGVLRVRTSASAPANSTPRTTATQPVTPRAATMAAITAEILRDHGRGGIVRCLIRSTVLRWVTCGRPGGPGEARRRRRRSEERRV